VNGAADKKEIEFTMAQVVHRDCGDATGDIWCEQGGELDQRIAAHRYQNHQDREPAQPRIDAIASSGGEERGAWKFFYDGYEKRASRI